MARPLRIQFPGAIYHVMNRGRHRQPIFLDPQADRSSFKRTLTHSVRLWKIEIHAYSLMDNHYHLLIRTPMANLSRAMRHIDGVYTQRFNRTHNRDGVLFRGRYKSKLVQEGDYFRELVRYIHLNGVKALSYSSARNDPNASHRDYLYPSCAPDWLTTDYVLSQFSNSNPREARKKLDQFVHEAVPERIQEVLDRKHWPAIFGAKDFIDEMQEKYLGFRKPHAEKPQERKLHRMRNPSRKKIAREVCQAFKVSKEEIFNVNKGKKNIPRQVLMWMLRKEGALSYGEIGKALGGISDSAIEMSCLRNGKSIETMKIVNKIRKKLWAVGI